jgi:hypothetical protein
MRRLLTATAAVVALLGGPAMAVDYVQCREMLRTKNELNQLAAEKEVRQEGAYPLPAECSGWLLDEISKQRCSDVLNELKSKRKVYLTLGSRNIYSEEAAKLLIAADKVRSDMKKASCPYQ